MLLNPADISEQIKSRIQGMVETADVRNQGTVSTVTDGICRIHGLSGAMQGEMARQLSVSRSTLNATW